MIGPGRRQECVETKDGLHIWEDHFYPEIIDPETGEVLPDGSKGELVFTSLTKEAFPIIRYRTRDLTRLLPGTARPGMRRIEKITGRSDDMIILRGVNVFPTQIEELLLETDWCSGHYQIELARPGLMDEMIVHAEVRGDKLDSNWKTQRPGWWRGSRARSAFRRGWKFAVRARSNARPPARPSASPTTGRRRIEPVTAASSLDGDARRLAEPIAHPSPCRAMVSRSSA